jgi:hypothetical protein
MRRLGVNLLNLLLGALLMFGVLEGVAYALTCWEEQSTGANGRITWCQICCQNMGTPAAQCTRTCRQ